MIIEKTKTRYGYYYFTMLLACLSLVATFVALWLFIYDKKRGAILQKGFKKKDIVILKQSSMFASLYYYKWSWFSNIN